MSQVRVLAFLTLCHACSSSRLRLHSKLVHFTPSRTMEDDENLGVLSQVCELARERGLYVLNLSCTLPSASVRVRRQPASLATHPLRPSSHVEGGRNSRP